MTCPFCQHQEHLPEPCRFGEIKSYDLKLHVGGVPVGGKPCLCHPTAAEMLNRLADTRELLLAQQRAYRKAIEAQDPHHSPPGSSTTAAG